MTAILPPTRPITALLLSIALGTTAAPAVEPAISGAEEHSLFLKSDGTVWMCGSSAYGQSGTGSTATRYTPTQVMAGVKGIASANYQSFFLRDDGSVWASGYNAKATNATMIHGQGRRQ